MTTDVHDHMVSHETIPGIGRATKCVVPVHHAPRPMRFVWHHILPQAAGGKTELVNLAELCDSCHYSVHIMLWSLAQGAVLPKHLDAGQLDLANAGYDAAVVAGTVALIPKESDVVIG